MIKLIDKIIILFILLLGVSPCFLYSEEAKAGDYKVGVYYFPGWKDNQLGAPSPLPWEPIKGYPEREPLLGWYKEGDDNVTRTHLEWMSKYHINFVVYDWYWGAGKTYLDHALSSYLRVSNDYSVGFSLLWANHSVTPKSEQDFASMVSYWCQNYFKKSKYQTINGMPVVYIFSASMLEENAKKIGKSTKELFELAQSIAKSNGLKGIYFVGGVGAYESFFKTYGTKGPYSAYSAYNYHTGKLEQSPPFEFSHSYEELSNGYQYQWDWFFKNQNIPYITPITAGWDKSPWKGSKDKCHDMSFSNPEQFKLHLESAKKIMDEYPEKSMKTTVICCWNEFGEGSVIEPTKKYGFDYLEIISDVFK